jgi:hypothetical protein
MMNTSRSLQSTTIRFGHNITTNSSWNESKVVSTIYGNGTSSLSTDGYSKSSSLIIYGSFLVFFVLIPLAILLFGYVTGRRLYMIIIVESLYTGLIDSSKGHRDELNPSRLKKLLHENSRVSWSVCLLS